MTLGLSRRAALGLLAGAVPCAIALGRTEPASAQSKRCVPFGSAVQVDRLSFDPAYRAMILRHCSIIVPEGGLKWQGLRPGPSSYWFDPGDQLVDFGERHGVLVRGHTLVWHDAMPDWVKDIGGSLRLRYALSDHIGSVVGRYKGRIASWDVVNEPLPEDQSAPHERRASLWHRYLGSDYIALALRLAGAADPAAELVINEYDLEFAGTRYDRKRAGMLDLLGKLRRNGAPLHAIGLQAHLRGEREIDSKGLARFIREVTGLGLGIVVTELDVMDWSLPADIAVRDAVVAARAAELLEVVFENCSPRAVLTWGLSDKHAWIPDHFKRPDKEPNRPLPLDADYAAKPFQHVLQRFGARERTSQPAAPDNPACGQP